MTPEKLSEWKKLAEAATEGPWESADCGLDGEVPEVIQRESDGDWQPVAIFADGSRGEWECDNHSANRAFIAVARTAVPELIAEVERLQRIIRWADEVKPCAVCGSKLMWAYAGDATFATECKTGERHKCPMHERCFRRGTDE